MFGFVKNIFAWKGKPSQEYLVEKSRVSGAIATPTFVRATVEDKALLVEAYCEGEREGALAQAQNVALLIDRCLSVNSRLRHHDWHQHPFIAGQLRTRPVDDIYIVQSGGAKCGVVWLRDYNDKALAPETFGELIYFWLRTSCRGLGHWPHVDQFARAWAASAGKTHLIGRCHKGSRRMAALFDRSGYERQGPSPSGMTVHISRPQERS